MRPTDNRALRKPITCRSAMQSLGRGCLLTVLTGRCGRDSALFERFGDAATNALGARLRLALEHASLYLLYPPWTCPAGSEAERGDVVQPEAPLIPHNISHLLADILEECLDCAGGDACLRCQSCIVPRLRGRFSGLACCYGRRSRCCGGRLRHGRKTRALTRRAQQSFEPVRQNQRRAESLSMGPT